MIWIYSCAVFLGAWLTFQIQPIIAKMILPEFGGLALVWTASLLFFQAMLLAGYAYAHIVARWLSPRKAWLIHLGLVLIGGLWLPPRAELYPNPLLHDSLTWSIVSTLAVSIGLPFLALAGTGPLLQWWWSQRDERRTPYRLYAASNLGSLLGLLSFPIVFESLAGLRMNGYMWSIGYVGFAVFCALCGPGSRRLADSGNTAVSDRSDGTSADNSSKHTGMAVSENNQSIAAALGWLIWSALGCGLFMAVANLLCQEVASFPFLWVAPLALYLTSYIVAFGCPALYMREAWLTAYLVAAVVALALYLLGTSAALIWQLVGFGGICFLGALICHSELYRSRPAAQRLTSFYLLIATGGLLGGVAVVVVCPRVLTGFYEFQWFASGVAMMAAGAVVVQRLRRGGTFDWVAGGWLFGTLSIVLLMVGSTWSQSSGSRDARVVFRGRSEYGLVAVYETSEYRQIVSGQTGHGRQFLDLPRSRQPIDYYDADSGAGRAMRALRAYRQAMDAEASLRIGVLGLGCGCLTTWVEPGDTITFYEINPLMVAVAQTRFTYLSQTPGALPPRIGDGRKLLAADLLDERVEPFDILFVDAFTSDSIPVHLLTREGRDLYWQRVRADGIVAFHITNRFIDLTPIVYDEEGRDGRRAILVDQTETGNGELTSKWVIVSGNAAILGSPEFGEFSDAWPRGIKPIVWTDDYSSVFWLVDWSPWIDWSGIRKRGVPMQDGPSRSGATLSSMRGRSSE